MIPIERRSTKRCPKCNSDIVIFEPRTLNGITIFWGTCLVCKEFYPDRRINDYINVEPKKEEQ